MMYGIETEKVGRRIGISSVWTHQTVVLNCRENLFLECMILPDRECRKFIVWSHEDLEMGCDRAEVQNGRL